MWSPNGSENVVQFESSKCRSALTKIFSIPNFVVCFTFSTILWRTGLETDSVLSGRLQVLRIRIGEKGSLVIDFKTITKFRGE